MSRAEALTGAFGPSRSEQPDPDESRQRLAEGTLARRMDEQAALYRFTDRLHRAVSLEDVYEAALDAIVRALRCERASILLFDDSGVMRFVAWRGLSDGYRRAVEGHSPWTADAEDPAPISIDDVDSADLPESLKQTVGAEGIGALAFIPLVAKGRLVGKFMTYYSAPHAFSEIEVDLALTIARQLGFGVERLRAEEALRESEQRFRLMADAAPVLVWIAGTDKLCTWFNKPWRDFVGRSMEQELGNGWAENVHADDFDRCLRTYVDAFDARKPFSMEYRLRRHDGEYRWVLDNGIPLEGPSGEFTGYIGSCIDITDRKRAEEALRESEQRVQVALEAGRMGAWEWDIASGAVIWSPSLQEIHGLKPGTFGGTFEDFTRDIHPDDLERVVTQVRQAVQTVSDYHVTYRMKQSDAVRWLEAFGRFALDADGKPQKLAGVCMDITERKRAESQRELLVAELSHRVKNTLATVISIARQSFSKNRNNDEAHGSFDARIRALAQTHSRLAEASWSGVSFQVMLLDEFAPYRREDGVNVRLSGPPIRLSPKCALTLGMAMHELATNAAKYGALSNKNGSVEVVWQVDPVGRQLRISWAESGGPVVVPPAGSGFGRLLLERALASDLEGSVQLDFAEDGLRCAIAIPLDEHVVRLA